MHLAIVTTYPPSSGSLGEYGFHLVKAFTGKPEVTRLSVLADTVDKDHDEPTNIHRIWRFNDPRNSLHIDTALDELDPDVVLFSFQFASYGDKRVPGALGLLAPYLSRRKRPTIALLHNIFETVDLQSAGFSVNPLVDITTRIAGKMLTRILLKSDLLALTIPRYVDILRDQYGARNVFLAPHGTFDAPPNIAPLPEVPTVLAFGKFGTYKKLEALLEAHGRLLRRDPRIKLVIAGSDSPNAPGYLSNIQRRYKDLPNIIYTGYVPEQDLPRTFQECTVAAFPYQSTTGSSGVLHQVGQYGRAAVMPRIGDLADLIAEEGYRATSFIPGDVTSLTEALWQVLSDPKTARELGEANHRVASGLLLSDVADWYLLHFQQLSSKRWTSANFKTQTA